MQRIHTRIAQRAVSITANASSFFFIWSVCFVLIALIVDRETRDTLLQLNQLGKIKVSQSTYLHLLEKVRQNVEENAK